MFTLRDTTKLREVYNLHLSCPLAFKFLVNQIELFIKESYQDLFLNTKLQGKPLRNL